jgi:lysophospholipase L1-like esterase
MLATADDTIYLFGDSITQHGFDPLSHGWVSLLSHAYMRRMTVINAGLSGYSSDQALNILPRMLPDPSQARIRLFVVFFGANDARLPGSGARDSPDQHVPKDRYKANLRAICTHESIKAHEKVKILLVTPPPVDENLLVRKNREARVTSEYAAQVRVLAQELANEGLDVRCLDIWTAFMSRCGWAAGDALLGAKDTPASEPGTGLPTLLCDGLHLTAGGNKLLFQCLLVLIRDHWPQLHPDALEFALPTWLDQRAWKEVFARREAE